MTTTTVIPVTYDILIINALENPPHVDIIPLSVYSQTTEVAREEEVDEAANYAMEYTIDSILDMGVLGINGNYISLAAADLLDHMKAYRQTSSDVMICSGIDGVCISINKFIWLRVKTIDNLWITIKYFT